MITKVNKYFEEVTLYDFEKELKNTPHNILRHPDMPQCAFKILWETLKKGETFWGIVKNLTKDGRFYWVMTEVKPIMNKNNEIIEIISYRKSVPKKVLDSIEPLYKELVKIENQKGISASEEMLNIFLKSNNTTYDKFIKKLLGMNNPLNLGVWNIGKKILS